MILTQQIQLEGYKNVTWPRLAILLNDPQPDNMRGYGEIIYRALSIDSQYMVWGFPPPPLRCTGAGTVHVSKGYPHFIYGAHMDLWSLYGPMVP